MAAAGLDLVEPLGIALDLRDEKVWAARDVLANTRLPLDIPSLPIEINVRMQASMSWGKARARSPQSF